MYPEFLQENKVNQFGQTKKGQVRFELERFSGQN